MSTYTREDTKRLFAELRETDDEQRAAELRETLAQLHLPLVEYLAKRFKDRGEPLDDLVSPLSPLRIDDLDSGAVLVALNGLTSLPTVEDDGQRMAFPVSIAGQEPQQRFPRHLGMRPHSGLSCKSQQIVAVDDHMHGRETPYAPPAVLST